ncbi:MAG: type II toxin-antitoxin system RelE family toxin [Anaerolineales bacterium]
MLEGGYKLVFTQSFTKDFRKLSQQNQERVRKRLEILKTDPYSGRKLESVEIGQYRIRVGDLRIRYDILEENVILLRVLKRENAYRRF